MDFWGKHPNCIVDEPSRIGDGTCHGGAYNTEACGFDDGDCAFFNVQYPNCTVDYPYYIGNDECDGGGFCIISADFISDDWCDGVQFSISIPTLS